MNNVITYWRTLDLQSMDIILCEGNSKMSKAIQRFQKLMGAKGQEAMISHVAGIYKTIDNRLDVQESTTLNKWADKKGVQSNTLEMWLNNYNGKVWIKQLRFERTPDYKQSDREFWIKHRHDPYESGIPGKLELLLCGLRLERVVRFFWKGYQPLKTKNVHCTELQGDRVLCHNKLMGNIPSNRMPPYFWWHMINRFLMVECVSENIRIK